MATFPHNFGVQQAYGAPQVSLIDQKIAQNKANLPSGLLLTHAIDYFNLGNDPKWTIIPETVKWQLFHAASAFKDANGAIHMSSGEFGIDHFKDMKELAFLYRIIRSYHFSREKNVYGQDAIFHKHIEFIEARFEKICREDKQLGKTALEALRAFEDENLAPLAMKLESIVTGVQKPAIQLSLIDSKIADALQTITLEMAQGKTDQTYPSGLLLIFAEQFYNLRNDPAFQVRISEEVKWQLLHAAKAYKHKDTKVIHLGENFSFEHLNNEHLRGQLAFLLMILTAYHEYEKTAKGAANAIFTKHIFMIESLFEHICWTKPENGIKAIATLKATHNHVILLPLIEKLEKILVNKDRYLTVPNTFENNPMLHGVFSARSPAELQIILAGNGPKAVMEQVKINYDTFLKWMKEVSDMEALEVDPAVQKAVRRWKSEIQERFYNKNYNLICQICEAYPELFKNTFARWNSLAILNDGAKIILDKFTKKGSIAGPVETCSSYQDYKEKLKAFAQDPALNGELYFSIRCESTHPYEFGVHQTGAYVEKINGQLFVQIIDSGAYDFDNGAYKVAALTKEVDPNAVLGSSMWARQRDFNNCAFFMFHDMKAISRNKANIQWLRARSINVLEYVQTKNGPDAVTFWKKKASQANQDVRITVEVPLEFSTPIQSLSQVSTAIKKPQGPSTPQAIAKLNQRVNRHKLIEMSTDNAVTGSDVSGYTKLKAMKYRLYIAQETFKA